MITVLFFLDTPLLTDTDDTTLPFVYTAAAPEIDGDWPGADVFVSETGGDDYDAGWFGFTSTDLVDYGYLTDAVPDGIATVPDRNATATVRFPIAPDLASASEDEVLADASLNLALVGNTGRWELVQYTTVTINGDGNYEIDLTMRGVRGTEQHTGTHVAGDFFVDVSSVIGKRTMGASEIGNNAYYKAVTFGELDTDRTPINATYRANALRPLSPVNIQIAKDPSTGDFSITWDRRTRIGGANIDGQNVPLGETSELYVLRILDGSGDTISSRQTTTSSYDYDVAEQVADWDYEQDDITVEIAQISPALNLEGFAAQASG